MTTDLQGDSSIDFSPLSINAHYTGSLRGLSADVLSAYVLGGRASTVCTSLIAAGGGTVTDVLEVPSDTVAAQLEHLEGASRWNAVRVGIVGSGPSAEAILRFLERHPETPSLLDVTLSGPHGEDIADTRVVETLKTRLGVPSLVSVRRQDAELLVSMEIRSLDDAQVAVQRFEKLGARRTLLRCGSLPARFFDGDDDAQPLASDLYYDGEDFQLYEAPLLDRMSPGASSLLGMAVLAGLSEGKSEEESLRYAKGFVTEALRKNLLYKVASTPYFIREHAASQ